MDEIVRGALRDLTVCGGGGRCVPFTHCTGRPALTTPEGWATSANWKCSEVRAASDASWPGEPHAPPTVDGCNWYDQQRPELFAEALKAAKRALDPNGVLNPGLLVDV